MSTTAGSKRSMSAPLVISLLLIASVWAAGAVWSFDHQKRFARALGFHHDYLLPAVADGLPVAMAAVAFSASLDGRGATAARLGTALTITGSAISNGMYAWRRSHDLTTVVVALAIPVMAAVAFEVLLGELRKSVMQARGVTPPVPVPHLRPIRVLLDPRREIAQWRRHVLTVTDPAADPVSHAVLSRLIKIDSSRPVALAGPAEQTASNASQEAARPQAEPAVPAVEAEGPREVFEAPRWPTETNLAASSETGGASRPSRPVPAIGKPHAETSRGERTETSRPSRSNMSRSRPSRSQVSNAETASRLEAVSRSEKAARVSQRAAMTAWAAAQLDAGREITGADLDRKFGTRNYGRAVLRELRAARATAASPAALPAGTGVSDG